MTTSRSTLKAEHDRIRALLDVFEAALATFEQAGQVDYDVLTGSLSYCKDFLDIAHHPKEEELFLQIEKRFPEYADKGRALHQQHADLSQLTESNVVLLEAVEVGATLGRQELVTHGRTLANAYRNHLTWEETEFFPLVDLTTPQSAVAPSGIVDPLTQSPVPPRYRAVSQALAERQTDQQERRTSR